MNDQNLNYIYNLQQLFVFLPQILDFFRKNPNLVFSSLVTRRLRPLIRLERDIEICAYSSQNVLEYAIESHGGCFDQLVHAFGYCDTHFWEDDSLFNVSLNYRLLTCGFASSCSDLSR